MLLTELMLLIEVKWIYEGHDFLLKKKKEPNQTSLRKGGSLEQVTISYLVRR